VATSRLIVTDLGLVSAVSARCREFVEGGREEREAIPGEIEGSDLPLADWRIGATAERLARSLRRPAAAAAAAWCDAALDRLARSLGEGHPLAATLLDGARGHPAPEQSPDGGTEGADRVSPPTATGDAGSDGASLFRGPGPSRPPAASARAEPQVVVNDRADGVSSRLGVRVRTSTEAGRVSPMLAIVFTDLVNSTLITSLLPGEYRAARDRCSIETIKEPHCRRLMDGLEAAGGRLVKDTGDGFLLVFQAGGPATPGPAPSGGCGG
jgi:hypothetical protein